MTIEEAIQAVFPYIDASKITGYSTYTANVGTPNETLHIVAAYDVAEWTDLPTFLFYAPIVLHANNGPIVE